MFSLSPFKASMYLQCPARYRFYYLCNFKKLERPKPYFVVGENVHFTLKKFFDFPPKERTYKLLEEILRKKWRDNDSRKRAFKNKQEEKEYGIQALLMLQRFWETKELTKEPYLKEVDWKTNLEDGLLLRGKIDRVDFEKNSLHIIDYKTGKERGEKEEENLQFLFYPLLAKKITKKEISKVSFFYLNSGRFKTKYLDEKDFKKAEEKILEIVNQIQKDKEFSPKPSNLCLNYCDFLDICPKRDEINTKHKEDLNKAPF